MIEYLASSEASKSEKAIGSYMLANMNGIPFETAASLAEKVGVSEPMIGRFCRSLGYPHFKAFKEVLREDIGDRPWLIGDRLQQFRERNKNGRDELAHSLDLEIAGLVAIYEMARSSSWKRAVELLSRSSEVYAAGFQTERGVAQIFVNQLQYLRPGVRLLDLAAGNFSELLLADAGKSCVVIFEMRRYSRLAPLLAQHARAAGIPVILVTDEFCTWGREVADEMFVVPTQFNLFWDSNSLMVSLTNLLINGVFAALGTTVEDRMNRTSELYSNFTGYVGDPSGPKSLSNALSKRKKGK
ncbi:MurR/RpiR family transcriptional regulator [Phyllobacterium sp. K27]